MARISMAELGNRRIRFTAAGPGRAMSTRMARSGMIRLRLLSLYAEGEGSCEISAEIRGGRVHTGSEAGRWDRVKYRPGYTDAGRFAVEGKPMLQAASVSSLAMLLPLVLQGQTAAP